MAKPILGFPSRTAAALALEERQIDRPEIARRLGLTTSQVSSLIYNGKSRPRLPSDEYCGYLRVPFAERDALLPAAVARRTSISDIAGRLLNAIVEDGLIEAILDDEPNRDQGAPEE